MQTKWFVVLNRGSGRGDADEIEQMIRQVLTQAGLPHAMFPVESPAQLHALARQAVSEAQAVDGIVVVVGGDGTINAVTQAVLSSGLRFGVLPQGTFNFFGRCQGLSTGDAGVAMTALLDAKERPVQVGLVNQRVFLVNASLGLYPELLEQREQDKQRFGRHRLVALGSGLAVLLGARPRLRLELECDGERQQLHTTTLVIGNNRLQLEQLELKEANEVERGRLVGIAVKPVGRWRMLGMAAMGLLGRLGEAQNVQSFAFSTLELHVRGRRRIKLALDGEITHLALPLRIRVASEPLRLLVPGEPVSA
ncbi:MAG: diacylglycerol kinase family protein [Dyella sp.]